MAFLWVLMAVLGGVVIWLMLEMNRLSRSQAIAQGQAEIAAAALEIQERLERYWLARRAQEHLPRTGQDEQPIDEEDPLPSAEEEIRALLHTVLMKYPGVEGGVWSDATGFSLYAYPTYAGSSEKTDPPEAELPGLENLIRNALRQSNALNEQLARPDKILLQEARALRIPGVPTTAVWTMKWLHIGQLASVQRARAAILAATVLVLAGGVYLMSLAGSWNAKVRRLLEQLRGAEAADLARLREVGETDLDRIIGSFRLLGQELEQARAELQGRHHQEARLERLAAVGQLAAGVAHELRNPAGAIRLKAENALHSSDPAACRAALQKIIRECDRLESLTTQLLQLTRPLRPQPERHNISELLAAVAEDIRPLARERGVKLHVQSLSAEARLDARLLHQALSNILRNALEHTPAGGEVSLSAREDGPRLIIRIRDTGPGIPPELRPRLFQLFASGRAGGHGLGLALAREAVEAMSGAIRLVDSQHGAEFEITLPCLES